MNTMWKAKLLAVALLTSMPACAGAAPEISTEQCPPELHKRFMQADAVVMGAIDRAEFLPYVGGPRYLGKKIHLKQFKHLRGKIAERNTIDVFALATREAQQALTQLIENKSEEYVFLVKVGVMPEGAPEDAILKNGKSWYAATDIPDVLSVKNKKVLSCLNKIKDMEQ